MRIPLWARLGPSVVVLEHCLWMCGFGWQKNGLSLCSGSWRCPSLFLFLDMIATRCIHNQLLYPGVTTKDHQQIFILHGQHVPGCGANRSPLLFLRLNEFIFCSFFVVPTSVFWFLISGQFQRENSIHHLNHKLDTAYPCYDSLKIAYWHMKNLSRKVHQELQLSTVCSSSLWNTNALVWA